jgi:hypothetical protein
VAETDDARGEDDVKRVAREKRIQL